MVNQYKKEIKIGDKVILWVTGEVAGVYALATVTSVPQEATNEEDEMIYYVDPASNEKTARVNLSMEYNLVNSPILKDKILQNEVLKDLKQGTQGTNFPATKYQYEAISNLINKKPLRMKSLTSEPLNQILYGPPGTGKTYHTVNKAVAIANPSFSFEGKSRQDIRDEYDRLKKDGQIEFVTFHQSMTYEDFIEGIKPKKPEVNDTFIKYEIQEGIFKRIAKRADYQPTVQASRFSLTPEEYEKASFYKISLGNTAIPEDEQIYRHSIDNGFIALGWGGANDFTGKSEHEIAQMVPSVLEKFEARSVNYFIHYLKVGDYVVASYGNLAFRAIGRVTGEYEYKRIKFMRFIFFGKGFSFL